MRYFRSLWKCKKCRGNLHRAAHIDHDDTMKVTCIFCHYTEYLKPADA